MRSGTRRTQITRFATGLIGTALLSASACSPKNQEAESPPAPTPTVATDSELGEIAAGEPHTAIPVEADDARLGNDDALVTVVAFLDFQCGFCARGFTTLMSLREKYSAKQLRIVFKHLPLESHEDAFPAAVVAQAVNQSSGSEKFFAFAGELFANQSRLDFQALANTSEKVGVERDAYNAAVGDEKTARRVVQDVILARRLGVDATPTFYVNGKLVPGAQPLEYFEQVIGEELALMKGSEKNWQERYRARVDANISVSLVESLLSQDPNDYRLPLEGSPVSGPETAAVTLVSFSDYECPFCKRAEDTVQQLQKKYGDDLRVVFKHLPLPFHKSARPAALLTSAVQKHQGDEAFFAASRDVFESSPTLDSSSLRAIGKKHGLNDAQVDAALEGTDADLQARLRQDADLADDVLARGTPHFFINGKRLSGARPLEQFEALIDFERKRARDLIAQGTEASKVYDVLQAKAEAPGAPTRVSVAIPSEGRPVQGPADAPVEVHVFSDFECPFCRRGEEALAELKKLYPDKLRIVWHDFPLPFHKRALPAARAAREARRQKGDDAFWKMHSALFGMEGDAPEVSEAQILDHGKKLGLDVKKLKLAIDNEDADDSFEEDMALAESLGIRGTPAFVIGGYLVTGAKPLRALQRVVDQALEDKKSQEATGEAEEAKSKAGEQ